MSVRSFVLLTTIGLFAAPVNTLAQESDAPESGSAASGLEGAWAAHPPA